MRNAEEITQLQNRIHETVEHRHENDQKLGEWQRACTEFHSKYDDLAFPGGLEGAYDRILSGDVEAIEAALCFLECRPFFFRSGYMFKDILRKTKRAPLDEGQSDRLNVVVASYDEYKQAKDLNKNDTLIPSSQIGWASYP